MIHKDDIGSIIRIIPEADTDINGAATAEIRYRKPSGAAGSWAAMVVDGAMEYTTQAGDIDEAGEWFFQGYVDLVTWSGSTTIVKSKVGNKLV